MNKSLMLIALDALAFFELCDADTLDPDTAIQHMEWISSLLNALNPEEKSALLHYANEVADEAEKEHGRREYIAFLRSLKTSFGWSDLDAARS